jgi:hypothetical protein
MLSTSHCAARPTAYRLVWAAPRGFGPALLVLMTVAIADNRYVCPGSERGAVGRLAQLIGST